MLNTRAATTNSITSAITELSHDSNAPMAFPFPFHGRPGLPHVDDFVAKCKLSYDHLRMMNMYEKKAMFLKAQLKAPEAVNSTGYANDNSPGPYAQQHRSSLVLKKQVRPRDTSQERQDDGSSMHSSLSSVSIRQVRLFIKYIHFFGEGDSVSAQYAGITYSDIETALRMHTRRKAAESKGIEETSDLLMAIFEDILTKADLTTAQWFQCNCVQVAGNASKLTKELFNRSIRAMCREQDIPVLTDQELRQLRLHLSTDGETEPTMSGVLRAFRRYNAMGEELKIQEAASPIIDKIKRLMRSRKIRIIDFFTYIDADSAIPISTKRLALSIDQLLGTASAVPLHSPTRLLKALPRSPELDSPSLSISSQSPSLLSPISRTSPPSTVRPMITWDTTLMVGMSPKKSGAEAVRPEILPADIATRLDRRYAAAQSTLYKNGLVYTHGEAKKKLAKLAVADQVHHQSVVAEAHGASGRQGGRSSVLMSKLTLGKGDAGHGQGKSDVADKRSPLSTPSSLTAAAVETPPPPPPKETPPLWTSMTLSDKFTAVAQKRTAHLLQSFSTYDRKLERHIRQYESFF